MRFLTSLLRYFNTNTIRVYKYYNEHDVLERVEVMSNKGYEYVRKVFKKHYVLEWERYVNMKKYSWRACGVWIIINEGYTDYDMVQVKKEFYNK